MPFYAALVLGYSALTLVMAAPLVDYAALGSATYGGDSRLLVWTLAWDAHAVLNRLPLFEANIFHPAAAAMQYAEHHLGIGLLALPFYAVTGNAVLAYWMVWLASFPANALAMHALGWRLTRNHLAAITGAVVFTFTFFRMLHAHGHIQLLWTAWLPLSILAQERWLRGPRPWRMVALWLLVLVQCLVTGYLAIMVLLAQVALLVVLVAWARLRLTAAHLLQMTVAAIAGATALWPLLAPYQVLRGADAAEAESFSASVAAYLLPPENTLIGRWLEAQGVADGAGIYGEQALFLGWVATALAAVGLVMCLRRRDRVPDARPLLLAVGVIGLLALGLSFGPTASGVAPFDFARQVPGLSLFRAPARFALLVVLATAAFAAVGAAWLGRGNAGRVVVACCLPLMLLEWRIVDFPSGKPEPRPTPAAYARLRDLPAGAIVSLPDYAGTDQWFREADYLLFSTDHWRPIANGYGRSEPPGFRPLMDTLRTFPSSASVEALRANHVRYVFWDAARAGEAPEDIRSRAVGIAGLRLVEPVGTITLFEVIDAR